MGVLSHSGRRVMVFFPTFTVLISYASAGERGASGAAKSPNDGPAFNLSLNCVDGRARFGGSCGSDDCGESMVVANVRVHGVRDRDMLRIVGAYNKHRDLGIEAAIVVCVYVKEERAMLWRRLLTLLSLGLSDLLLSLQYPNVGIGPWATHAKERPPHQVSNRANTSAAAAAHIRGHPCTPASRPSSTYTESLRQHTQLPSPYPLYLLRQPRPIAVWEPGAFTNLIGQRPRLAQSERDTFIISRESSRLELYCGKDGQETRGCWRRGTD